MIFLPIHRIITAEMALELCDLFLKYEKTYPRNGTFQFSEVPHSPDKTLVRFTGELTPKLIRKVKEITDK